MNESDCVITLFSTKILSQYLLLSSSSSSSFEILFVNITYFKIIESCNPFSSSSSGDVNQGSTEVQVTRTGSSILDQIHECYR